MTAQHKMTAAERISTFASVPLELATLVVDESDLSRIHVTDIRSNCRRHELVRARWRIADKARANGFSLWQIARALNRDHTTIIYGLGQTSPDRLRV